MELIVEQFALLIGALDCRELSPADRVSSRNARGFVQNKGGARCNRNSRLHHDLVDNLWVGFHLKFSLLIDVHEAGKESFTRDSEVIKF